MSRIVTLHMEFVGGEPPGWRVVEVPWSTKLAELDSMIRDVFEDLPPGAFFRREEFPADSAKRVVDLYGKGGNRIDYLFDDNSNPLVIWNEGTAQPTSHAYPRLVHGGESLLDEREPAEASTIEARELDGTKSGEWEEPQSMSEGTDMIRRFLEAKGLMEQSRETFENLVDDSPELFDEFEWATHQLAEAKDDLSPRMRRPFHALSKAGIPIEEGLLDQVRRTALYRADVISIGLYAELLAGLGCEDAIEPLVELLKLDDTVNPRAYDFVRYALAELDGPEYERVFALLPGESATARLDVLTALSHATPEHSGLAERLFSCLDELDEESRDFAMIILEGLHTSIAEERVREMRGVVEEEDPTFKTGDLPGRNDPCFCGSGKKYKKCCMRK